MVILTLNQTCKGYATRDILIPGKVKHDVEYLDFIPHSQIQASMNITNSIDIEFNDEEIVDYHMYDLDLISKSSKKLWMNKTVHLLFGKK